MGPFSCCSLLTVVVVVMAADKETGVRPANCFVYFSAWDSRLRCSVAGGASGRVLKRAFGEIPSRCSEGRLRRVEHEGGRGLEFLG